MWCWRRGGDERYLSNPDPYRKLWILDVSSQSMELFDLIWKSAANITWWVYWMRNRGLLLPFFGPFFIQVSLLTNWPVLSNFIIWKCTVEKGQRNEERYPIPTLIADSEFCRDSWRTVWSTLIWPAMSNFIIWKCTVEKIKQMQWRKASNPDS